MNQLTQVTSATFQKQTIPVGDGTYFSLTIYYMPMQQTWVITELIYGSFTLNGFRISNSPNMLHQFINQIPFGLACFSIANREPMLQQDFAAGNSSLYVLSAAECLLYAEYLSGQISI